jgi:hypothetical protein
VRACLERPVYRKTPKIDFNWGIFSLSDYFCLPFFSKKDEPTKSDSEPV